jgi:hypothetical protein
MEYVSTLLLTLEVLLTSPCLQAVEEALGKEDSLTRLSDFAQVHIIFLEKSTLLADDVSLHYAGTLAHLVAMRDDPHEPCMLKVTVTVMCAAAGQAKRVSRKFDPKQCCKCHPVCCLRSMSSS